MNVPEFPIFNPQSWNGYSYVANNPLTLIDPTGLDTCPARSENNCVDVNGGLPDPVPTDPCFFFNCWSGGVGYYDKPLKLIPPPPPTVPRILANYDIDKLWSRTFPCNGNAEQLMAAIQGNMNTFAGNRGTFFAADFPTQPIRLGGQYDVEPGVNAHNGYEFPTGILAVTVTSQSSTGWTFTTDPSQHYFAGTVSFSAANAGNGNVSLSVTAKANFVSQFVKYTLGPLIKAGENSTWENMMRTAQGYCEAITF